MTYLASVGQDDMQLLYLQKKCVTEIKLRGKNVDTVDCGEKYLLENLAKFVQNILLFYKRYCQFNYGTIRQSENKYVT